MSSQAINPPYEEWRDVGSGVEVSNLGRVRRNKILLYPKGYKVWVHHRGGEVKIAHLVLEAFVGPCPVGMECCHYDDDKFNNELSNLRWDTHSNNLKDRCRNIGRWNENKGEGNPAAKLTEARVVLIRLLHKFSPVWTGKVLSDVLGIPQRTVYRILARTSWKDTP
jgi:hypothetical protein